MLFLKCSAARHSASAIPCTLQYFKVLLLPCFRWIPRGNRKHVSSNFGFLCWANLKTLPKMLLNHLPITEQDVSWCLRLGSKVSSNAGVSWPERWAVNVTVAHTECAQHDCMQPGWLTNVEAQCCTHAKFTNNVFTYSKDRKYTHYKQITISFLSGKTGETNYFLISMKNCFIPISSRLHR